jgi:hypothetical protein
MTSFYDNINNYFEKDTILNSYITKPDIYNLQSEIIKEYTNILEEGSDEYFEDKIMTAFNEYFNR